MRTRLKIIPTQRCAVDCPMCYWPLSKRHTSGTINSHSLEQIVLEGKGMDDLHLFSGEYSGYFEELFLPILQLAERHGYKHFMTTSSGVFIRPQDIDVIMSVFSGKVRFQLSVDGGWGHGNANADGRHGDILSRFLDAREKYPERILLSVNWTHKPSARNDALLEAAQRRCRKSDVRLLTSYVSDLKKMPPTWGEQLNPGHLGLDSPEIDTMSFAHCSYPAKRYEHRIKQVQVGPSGGYYLCKCSNPYFLVGRAGRLGEGNLIKAIQALDDRIPRFVNIIEEDGILGVLKALLKTPVGPTVAAALDNNYPKNCGGCIACTILERYFPLLEDSLVQPRGESRAPGALTPPE